MDDYVVRATAAEGSVRVFAARTNNTVNKAFNFHKTSPVATAALGRLLTAVSIMGCTLKNESDIITAFIKGDGPLQGVVATSDFNSNVKGYVNQPIVNIPLKKNGKLDVGGAIGNGVLTITKDLGLKHPVSGQIALVSGEIADDLTYYFAKSEQIPSAVSLGVLVDRDYTVKQAGGFIIQMMPNATEEIISFLERRLPYVDSVTKMLEDGKSPEDMIKILFENNEFKIYDKIPVSYNCDCSREKVYKALLSVGLNELNSMIKEDGEANVHCHFCNKDYKFTITDLNNLIDQLTKTM